MQGSDSCSPDELYGRLQGGDAVVVLDVRRKEELALARVDPALNIPLDELETRIGELEPLRGSEIIVMCHHGIRSRQAMMFLANKGFAGVRNLAGGIAAYANVDSSVGKY